MRFIKLFLISAGIFGGLVFLLSLLFPSTAYIDRSGSIAAPPEKVYQYLEDLNHWVEWNPWHPGYRRKHPVGRVSEPSSGPGATITWAATEMPDQENAGKIEIVSVIPGKQIVYKLLHSKMKPVTGYIDLKPTADGKGTAIQWRMEVHVGLAPWWKLRGFMMDRMYGSAVEDGLNNLRSISERP